MRKNNSTKMLAAFLFGTALLVAAADGAITTSGKQGSFEGKTTSPEAFIMAIRRGNRKRVEAMIRFGADVNAADDSMFTPLAAAALSGKLKIARILITAGANVDGKHPDYILPSPLHRAAEKGNLKFVKLLISHGADVNSFDSFFTQPIHEAASQGNTLVLEELIRAGADVNAGDYIGDTPLFRAGDKGRTAATKVLIENNADIHAVDRDGLTALHLAAEKGSVGVIKVLVAAGADVLAITSSLDTPLHKAASGGHTGAIKTLLNLGAEIESRNGAGYTALSLAAASDEKRFRDAVKVLKRLGADSSVLGEKLMIKLLEGDIKAVKGLVLAGANVNSQSKSVLSKGQTPLHMASSLGKLDLIEILLNVKSDKCIEDAEGRTAFELFCLKATNKGSCQKNNKRPKELKCSK